MIMVSVISPSLFRMVCSDGLVAVCDHGISDQSLLMQQGIAAGDFI